MTEAYLSGATEVCKKGVGQEGSGPDGGNCVEVLRLGETNVVTLHRELDEEGNG